MLFFWVVGMIGVAILLLSLVLGEIFDSFFQSFEGLGGEWFSTAGLAGFLGAFGIGGGIASNVGLPVFLAVVVGLAAGAVTAVGVGWAINFLRKQGNYATVDTKQVVGSSAQVSNAIPEDGYGEIKLVIRGNPTRYNAKADYPIPAGEKVWITEVLSATAVRVEAESLSLRLGDDPAALPTDTSEPTASTAFDNPEETDTTTTEPSPYRDQSDQS
ncbi:NfeD family protein [Parenemella sanctibonifatiensis]|nr:NfeD family protein [Parenemella sanctibonifatiensis]